MRTAVDTSVLVAAVSAWHEDHERCRIALDTVLAAGTMVLPQHVAVETYSVLTRLPAPRRLSAETALDILTRTLSDVPAVDLPVDETWGFLKRLRDSDVKGGAAYDALILDSALAGGAERVLTLNLRQFERLAPSGLEVVAP